MNKYIFKLKPIENYFFGGETTFGDDRNKQDYFVKSNYYPQQTTLLGMLRFELLKYYDLLPLRQNKTAAKKRIGEKSFCIENDKFEFGDIKGISPLFMLHEGIEYYFGNDFAKKKLKEENGKSYTNDKQNKIAFLPDYDPKTYYPEKLIAKDDTKFFDLDNIFIEQTQVGIAKPERDKNNEEPNKNEETNEDAFYRQTFYRLAKDWEFSFIAELNENSNFGITDKNSIFSTIVILGAERSQFYLEIKKTEDDYNSLFKIEDITNAEKAVLMCDAKVENTIYNNCKFAITQTQDFRSLIFDNSNYAKAKKQAIKYNLLKRGSVFFIKNQKEFDNQFNIDNLKKIGLNNYKLLK